MKTKNIAEWIKSLTERPCGTGQYILLHPSTDVPMNFTAKNEFVNRAFTGNTTPTVLTGEWQDIEIPSDYYEAEGFVEDDGGSVYQGNCPLRKLLILSCKMEATQNNTAIEMAVFVDRGEGFEIVEATLSPMEFRFADVISTVAINYLVSLNTGDHIKPMIRRTAGSGNVIIASMFRTIK